MRRTILLLVLLLVPFRASAQAQHSSDAGHGIQKVSQEAAHSTEGNAAHEEAKFLGLPTWIFKLVNMFLFLGLLGYFVGGPVKRALAARTAAIQLAAEEARTRRVKADQVAGDIRARLALLEDEVKAIRERAQQEGERQKRELVAAAEAEAAKILASARAEVDNKLKNARQELTEYAGQLASDRAEHILRERITPDDQRKIFQESLKQVEEVSS